MGWGNAAADQREHDVYIEVLDYAYRCVRGGGRLDEPLWTRLAALADAAMDACWVTAAASPFPGHSNGEPPAPGG